MNGITRALIPAAGFGSRMRPLTAAVPKEMLPLGRKPVLEYIVEELESCGICEILLVISSAKEGIRSYFGSGEAFGVSLTYTVQEQMRGLGDAVLHGSDWAGGDPFVVAFGDCIIESAGHDALKRLIDTHRSTGAFASALAQEVLIESVSKYGILRPAEPAHASFRFDRIIEKPPADSAPSRWAVAARWILDQGIFTFIEKTTPDSKGEVGLSQAVDRALLDGREAWAVPLKPDERRLDIGSWDTYLAAAARAIINDPDYGENIRRDLSI
jgi:UTP--glucose-1-phosphate uridylyltransferase